MGLFAFLRPDRERVDHLERRLDALVVADAERQVAFLAIAEQVKRHLQRAATIEQRAKGHSPDPKSEVVAAVLRSKFPQRNGE